MSADDAAERVGSEREAGLSGWWQAVAENPEAEATGWVDAHGIPYSPERVEVIRVSHLLGRAWLEAENGKPPGETGVSYVATFADMARAVIADSAALRAQQAAEAGLSNRERLDRLVLVEEVRAELAEVRQRLVGLLAAWDERDAQQAAEVAEAVRVERERIAVALEGERSRQWQEHLRLHPHADSRSCPRHYGAHDAFAIAAGIARAAREAEQPGNPDSHEWLGSDR